MEQSRSTVERKVQTLQDVTKQLISIMRIMMEKERVKAYAHYNNELVLIRCSLCHTECNNYHNYIEHIHGKTHFDELEKVVSESEGKLQTN